MNSRKESRPRDYVTLVLNGEIRVENATALLADEFKRLGGHSLIEGGETWIIPYDGEEHLVRLLDELNRLGVLFVGQPAGWPPSAIFEDLRDRGLLRGLFSEVTWTGPGKWSVRSR